MTNGLFNIFWGIGDNGEIPNKVTQLYVAFAVNALIRRKLVKTSITNTIGRQIHFEKDFKNLKYTNNLPKFLLSFSMR